MNNPKDLNLGAVEYNYINHQSSLDTMSLEKPTPEFLFGSLLCIR